MPDNEDRGEERGTEAGRKTFDSAVTHDHPEDHPDVGLKGGRRDIEHMDEADREIVERTEHVDE